MALNTSNSPSPSRFAQMLSAYRGSNIHQGGINFLKYDLGIHPEIAKLPRGGMKMFARWGGRAYLAYGAYQGYKQGGVVGAATETGKHLAVSYGMGAAMRAVGMTARLGPYGWAALGVAALAGIGLTMTGPGRGLLSKGVRPWVNQHMKKRAELELATPVVDDFGTVATMRQRSLQAIQNSRINGRTALGNEAALMYQPYFR